MEVLFVDSVQRSTFFFGSKIDEIIYDFKVMTAIGNISVLTVCLMLADILPCSCSLPDVLYSLIQSGESKINVMVTIFAIQ